MKIETFCTVVFIATGLTLLRTHFKAHDEALAILFRDLVDGANTGMVQGGRSLSFPLETAESLCVVSEFVGKELQGDVATKPEGFGFVDHAHGVSFAAASSS